MTARELTEDEHWMQIAFQLAERGQGHVEPNPMVGCVLVKDGVCIANGYHASFGGPHAEVAALRALLSADDACGATAYVTLEPCCHHGKTPPCSTALIAAGVRRVVIAMQDPFPKVAGGGIRQLTDAGIEVTTDVLRPHAEALLAPYRKRIHTGLPWVIAKWAMTADGRIATVSGKSQWISSPESRSQVHRLRSRVDAILVGMGTVDADDPMLDARLGGAVRSSVDQNSVDQNSATNDPDQSSCRPPRIAKRVVLCRHRIPAVKSKLIQTAAQIPTWLFVAPDLCSPLLDESKAKGAVVFPLDSDDPQTMVRQTLLELGRHEMTNVMIEGGATLMASFIDRQSGECWIDECHVYVGAKLFGGQSARGPIGGDGIEWIESTPALSLHQLDRFGDDVRMIYRVQPR